MALRMRNQCEQCGCPLSADATAFICSYERTFCPECKLALRAVCPCCEGDLAFRPRRPSPAAEAHPRAGDRLSPDGGERAEMVPARAAPPDEFPFVLHDLVERRRNAALHVTELIGRLGGGIPTEPHTLPPEIPEPRQRAPEQPRVAEDELRRQADEVREVQQTTQPGDDDYRHVFVFLPAACLVTDARGVLRSANRAAEALFGVTEEGLRGKPLAVFLAENARWEFRGWLNRTCQQSASGAVWQTTLLPRNAPPVPATLRVTPAHDPAGEIFALYWTIRAEGDTTAAPLRGVL